MGRTNIKDIKPREMLNKLMDQAKELTTKPVENISDSITNKSLEHIDEHYILAKNEEIATITTLLKEQEDYLNRLSEGLKGNDEDLKDLRLQLASQERMIGDSIDNLKAENKRCTNELKGAISGVNQMDYGEFEEAFREGSESLVSQQQAHAVEMDRMMMSLKMSIEKNIEKMKGVLEKKVEASATQSGAVIKVTMVLTIINLLCLVAYIVYDILLH